MPQPHGLGRGLASLIPQKKSSNTNGVLEEETKKTGDVANTSHEATLASPFLGAQKVGVSQSSTKGDEKRLSDTKTQEEKNQPVKKRSALDNLSKPKVLQVKSMPIKPTAVDMSPGQPVSSRAVYEAPADAIPSDTKVVRPSLSQEMKVPVEQETNIEGEVVLQIAPENIAPNPHQPRLHFDEEKLTELAQSIKEHGILQPLVVTRTGENAYELIAGERRLEAAKMVGLSTVPVLVRDAENRTKFELAIIENIQRHNLNPIEEARAYDRLSKEFDMAQEEIAEKMGKSRSAVANTLRLLHLPVEIQRTVMEGKLSEGHAKALLSLSNPEKQRALFEMIMREGLTVREAEEKSRVASNKPPRRMAEKDPETKAREESLSEMFGTKVRINRSGGGGSIRIDYYSPEEFQNILSKLSQG